MECGIVIWANESHFLKAFLQILTTEAGNKIFLIDEHDKKAPYPIFSNSRGNMTFSNELQSEKAYDWILVTDEGISISLNDEQPQKHKLINLL